MKTLATMCALIAVTFAQPASAELTSGDVDGCLAQARARATEQFLKDGKQDRARLLLEIEAAKCFNPALTAEAAHVVGTVHADRAYLAYQFLNGKISLTAYRAMRKDRSRKLVALESDAKAQQALMDGDADGDLVPDAMDRCPRTAAGVPTDAGGCPIRVRPRRNDAADERRLRATLAGSRTLFNRSCEGAPRPDIPSPLEWGRGRQTKLNTVGFNLAVAKIDGQPEGCEVFYEMQFRFIEPNPGNPALSPTKIVTIVFSHSEDLLSDPVRAVFGLPVAPAALSAGRAAVREAFLREYFRASWRVRAVNGANQTSPWSAFVTQGPASGGVDG
jgi:hypothetical protein